MTYYACWYNCSNYYVALASRRLEWKTGRRPALHPKEKAMKKICVMIVVIALLSSFAFAYSVILKNGKTFEGTLVTDDAEKITIKDKDGVVLNFKKPSIDLEKTAEANKPAEKPAAEPPKETPATEKKDAAPKVNQPKKAGRVYTADDLYRLRGQYPLDNSGADIQSPSPDVPEAKGMSGDEWLQLTQNLVSQIKQAEQNYQKASAQCKQLQGATIQTHMVLNGQGQPVDMVQATKDACQAADQAKSDLDSAHQAYDSAVEQAKQQGVLPGYIAEQ
jgi:hypothetical protein